MATLPGVLDYGARPSLRTNRLDDPGTGSSQSADALSRAANTFAAVLEERQNKEDSLNYALARNEVQAADLLEREKLANDQDYATHDERYTNGFKTARELITAKYHLSNHDSAIFDAESNLIGARGGVQVRERVRKLEIDEGYSRLIDGMEIARENLINADPESRNAIVEGQLDAINAARDKGFIDSETKAEVMRQKLTQEFALATIEAMPVEEQIVVLTESLAMRKGYDKKTAKGNPNSGVGPVSADDIRSEQGSDSIADFLHADTAAKMLQTALDKNKTTRDRTAAYAVEAEAMEMYPEDPTARMKYIRQQLKGNADVLDVALRAGRTRNEEERIADSQEVKGIILSASELMETGIPSDADPDEMIPYTYDMIEPENVAKLSPQQKETLQTWDRMQREGEEFATPAEHDWDKWGEWQAMSPRDKAEEPLESAEWKTTMKREVWTSMMQERKRERDAIEAAEAKPPVLDTGSTPDQLLTDSLDRMGMIPRVGRTPEENQGYSNSRWEFKQAITERSEKLGRKLTPDELDEELAKVLKPMAFPSSARSFFSSDYTEGDQEAVATMSVEERNKAYLNLDKADADIFVAVPGAVPISVTQHLQQRATELLLDPDDVSRDDFERAYFAFKFGLGQAEVDRRLEGK